MRRIPHLTALLSITGLVLFYAAGSWEWHREAEQACNWVERGDMYEECLHNFNLAGSDGVRIFREQYGFNLSDR